MVSNERSTASESSGPRRRLRLEREQSRRLTIRHRWYAGGIATVISAALVFSGVSTPALADTTPTPAPTETTEPVDESTAPADEATPPADDTAPTDETAPADEATPTPTPVPTETTPAAEPTPEPTETTAPVEGVDESTPTPTPTPTPTEVAEDDKANDSPDVGVLTVPDPGPTTAVITVKVGSDRTGITGVTPLAGVVLLLNTGNAGQTGPSGTRPDGVAGTGAGWALCTSDAQGDCSFTVPNTQAAAGATPAGVNRDARFWVVQASVPAGYYSNPSLRTGGSGGEGTATRYTFRTGTQLRANNVYSSQDANDFMLSSGTGVTASGGIWQQSRVNPGIPQSCGIDVALILDLSGSVAPSVVQLKQAADTFVDALQGTPSRMSLFSFSTATPAIGATQNYPSLTSVSTVDQANAFKERYQDWTATGFTNWDRGLGAADAANSPANNFDLAVVITDGNPTAYNQPAQGLGNNRFRETENGIFSANGLKEGPDVAPAPTRVLAFGVGDGATGAATALNLRAISGTTAYNGTNVDVADYFQTEDYPAAGQALRALALGNCEGSLTVTKQIVPNTAPAGSIDGAVAAGAGWQFTTAIAPAAVTTPNPVQTTTANGTGTVNFPLTFTGGTTTGSVTVTEAQQTGFTLQPVNNQNAVCLNISNDPATPVPVTNATLGFTVDVPSTAAVSCTVYNRAPNPPADITVHKTWVINGVTYENGAQPSNFSAQLQLTGPGAAGASNQGWDVTRTGYTVGNTTTLSESVTLVDPTMCTNTAAVTSLNGASVNLPLGAAGYLATLSQPQNLITITNTVTCRSTLTLIKQVQNGGAAPNSWTLNASFLAVPPINTGLPGFSGASGTSAATSQDVTPNARYQLFENGGDPRYLQTDNRTNLQANPLSTGSATCIRVNADGTPFPGSGYSDGINGGVNVPIGFRVACTFVNQTAALTLLKNVVNNNGGSATASAWDVTATPAPLTGLTATTVDGSEGVVPESTFQVRPDHVYTLTESSVPGYEFSKLQEFVNGTWVDVVANPDPTGYPQQDGAGNWQVTVAPLDNHAYRFVNDDVAPTLTLVKTVTNDNGGTAVPTAWTLTATTPGGPNLSGATGSAAVTTQPVRAGVAYTIGESGGPAAYEWASLTCTGSPNTTVAAPTLTLQPGDDVTCTLNNDDILVPVTVAKADGVAQQLADGTWSIEYEVVVTNTSATLPTTYSLADVPGFDSSFTVLSQGWQDDPDVTDVAIEGGGTDTYTYVVTAEANETQVDPTALVCTPADGGGFFNTATVTFPGGQNSDTGCAVPASPVVQKVAQPSVQDITTGAWTLSYEITVSNPSTIPLAYTLSDTAAALPAGVTGGAWAASDPVAVGGGTFLRNPAWAGSGELATGTLPAGATHTYTVTRAVDVAATVTEDALTCGSVVNQGGGVWNTATVTNGIAVDDSSDCAEIVRPDVTIEKTVTDTVQLVDGTWEITYNVVVTNTSADLATVYSLGDVLTFGGDVTVDDASWSGPTSGDFSADGTATLATNRALAADGIDTYTVTAHATVDQAAWDGDTLTCEPGDRPAAGGFLNVANLTVNGEVIPADDCSEPALPTIQKDGVSATQDPDDPSRWLVSYNVTVTSGGYDTFYSLSDTPGFPVGVTLSQGQAQRTDIPDQPVVAITTGADFATDVALPAGEVHTYRVSWLVDIADTADPDDADCTGQPGNGFFNTATLTVGAIPIDDDACVPVVNRVYPTVTKTVTSTNQDPVTGDWTITYDLVVALAAGGTPANPLGISAEYDLSDTLDFGGDINIGSAEWSGESSGDFPAPDATATLATDHEIDAGDTHTYTITVVAEVTPEAIENGTTECVSGGDGGGFLNTALLTSGGQDTPVEACSEPIFPDVEKSAVGTAVQDPDTGDWTVTYDITVSYPDTDADPLPILGYVLTDAPDLPDGVELVGDWTAAAANGDTPDPDDPTWDGTGTWTITTAAFDPEDDAVTEHVYTVTAVVSVTGPPAGDPEDCAETQESGIVVWNTAIVTSGGYEADDDACQVVFFDDVGIVKTATRLSDDGSVEPGDSFDYVLTVTNYGDREATNVHVTDDDLSDRLEITALAVDPALAWGPAPGYTGNVVDLTIDALGIGESATITVSVTFLAADTPPIVDVGSDPNAVPEPLEPLEELTNTACVAADIDGDPTNNCDDLEIPVRDIAVVLYTQCVNDAPLLGWVATKSESLNDEPFTFLWTPGTPGNPAPADTDPGQVLIEQPDSSSTWSDLIPWVGTQFTPSGVSIDFPGWRPIVLSDVVPGSSPLNFYLPGTNTPMTPEERAQDVFNGLILDPTTLNYAWRNPTTVTFSVNPELTFTVDYPAATPECFVARHTELQIEKTASVERTEPGKSFTYTLDVQNVSDDSAAEGVVVTDDIPADLKITDVSWPGEGDPNVFPNWSTCAVTGQSSSGYGGQLTCELFGLLFPANSGQGATSTPTITLAATVHPSSTATVITNVSVVDYYTFGDPGDPGRDADDATVTLSSLPPTGGGPVVPLVIFGVLAMLAGLTALVVRRRRRSEVTPTL